MPTPRPASRSAVLALAAVALLTPARLAGAAEVDSALSALAPGESRPAIVVLSSQADARRDPADLRQRMHEVARRTQPAVVRAAGGARRRFWLVNAIALDATGAKVRRLAALPGVAAIVPDPVVTISEMPSVLRAPGPLWGMTAIGAPQAASLTGLTGSGVRIGSIDTGVDASHPDLRGRIAAWRDFVGSSASPYDDNGHGTHTIGRMVGGGGTGVAPGATVVVAKAMDAGGEARGSAILAAAQWMTDPDGDPATPDQPSVVNGSWGASGATDPWFRPMVRRWLALGIVPVFAAGNGGPGPGTIASPAGYPEVLAVGAVGASGAVAGFSARGPVVWTDPDGEGPAAGTRIAKPDLVAPGVDIVSTVPGGGYAAWSGTSMAAPHVAATAALVREAAPGLSPAEVMDVLRRTVVDRGAPGVDPDYGHGMLDVPAALAAVGGIPAPSAPAPRPDAGSGKARAGVSLADLRRSRRLALAAEGRLRALERRVGGPRPPAARARSLATVRLRPAELLVTRRIADRTLTRARRLSRRLDLARPLPPARAPRLAGPVALSPGAARDTERFARVTLRTVLQVGTAMRARAHRR
jgi:bacillopeptidase F